MRRIKDIIVINEESASRFQVALKAEVDEMQAKGLQAEIKNPQLVVTPDKHGSFNYVAVVIGCDVY